MPEAGEVKQGVMRSPPKAIIKDGKVVNAEQLRRYWRDKGERDWVIRQGMFRDIREAEAQEEKPQPETPEWSSRQFDIVNQLRGQVLHLENRVIKLLEKKTVEYTIKEGVGGGDDSK